MVLPSKHQRLPVSEGSYIVGRVEVRDVQGKSLVEFLKALELEIKGLREDMISARSKLLGGNTNE